MFIVYLIRYYWDKYCYGLNVENFDEYVDYIKMEDDKAIRDDYQRGVRK